jgi:REP element-mobilizing transposase RayT
MARPRRTWQQISLDRARRCTGHGGWRPGAGRPRGRKVIAHDRRPTFTAGVPQHVTLRLAEGVPSIRRERTARVVRAAILAGGHRDDFRVIELNVLGNHLHLLVEADDERALARGMQGLNVRLARRLNAVLGRRGPLFATRYHARALRTPREVRAAIRYVLLNARHHAAERGVRLARCWVDPFSSAPWFDGWRAPMRTGAPWLRDLLRTQRPTAPPRTWLLRIGWRRGGLLAFDDVPGRSPTAR